MTDSTLQRSCLDKLLQFDEAVKTRQVRQLKIGDTNDSDMAIVGIDEVGRGSLAGPVVAAAVALPEFDAQADLKTQLSTLNDSKLLSASKREILASTIQKIAMFSIGEASAQEIDELNILQASLLAMRRAYLALGIHSRAILLVDGNCRIPDISDEQITVVKGDSCSAAIAAASIVAKVHRDALMCRLAEQFPKYQWHRNKGYGTKEHQTAIEQSGLTPWHRMSFNI